MSVPIRLLCSLVVAFVVYQLFKPQKPEYVPYQFDPVKSVSVSGYQRSDGTHVSDHARSAPGAKQSVDAANQAIAAINNPLRKEYNHKDTWAFLSAAGSFCACFYFLCGKWNQPKPAKPSDSTKP